MLSSPHFTWSSYIILLSTLYGKVLHKISFGKRKGGASCSFKDKQTKIKTAEQEELQIPCSLRFGQFDIQCVQSLWGSVLRSVNERERSDLYHCVQSRKQELTLHSSIQEEKLQSVSMLTILLNPTSFDSRVISTYSLKVSAQYQGSSSTVKPQATQLCRN